MLQTIYALHLFVFWIKAVIFNTRFFLSLSIWSPSLLFYPVRLRYKWWLFKLEFWLFIIKRMYFWFFWHKTYSAWPSWNIIFATPISSFVWIVKWIWYTLLIQHLITLIFGHYDQSLNSPLVQYCIQGYVCPVLISPLYTCKWLRLINSPRNRHMERN